MVEEDSELKKLLDRITKKIISKSKGGKVMEVYRTKIVKVDSPHGIYRYDRTLREWILIDRDGDGFKPYKDGYYILYFDNTKCAACRIYDLFWYPFIETIGKDLEGIEYVIILCEWFAKKCNSRSASNTFREFDIHASPSTAFIEVRGNKIIKKEIVRGVLKIEDLVNKTMEFTGIKI